MKTDREIKILARKKYYWQYIESVEIEDRKIDGYIDGYKQAQQELYTEDEVLLIIDELEYYITNNHTNQSFEQWFNEVKKK